MKVTAIKTFLCHVYRTNWVFVKVLTDEGIYGVGEATLEMREQTVVAAIKELERYLVGKDPHNIESFFHDNYRDAYWRGGAVLMSALAGVEMALWDIKGKALGVPVYQLLGGKVRDKIACYANGWFAGAKEPEEFAAKAKIAAKSGFKALKWDPFGSAYLNLTKEEFNKFVDCLEAVNDAVGDQTDLLIEGHGRFNVPTAIRIGKVLEDYHNILWFEEPLPPDNLRGTADIKNRVKVPIAAGERLYSRWDYRHFFELKAADYIQADISHCGLMESRKIAAMGEAYHIPYCPHNPSGPVANAATLQLAACTPNFYLLETMNTDIPHRKDVCVENVKFENGMMYIPDTPGLGVDINEDEIAKHPYEARNLRHYTAGQLTDIRPKDAGDYLK